MAESRSRPSIEPPSDDLDLPHQVSDLLLVIVVEDEEGGGEVLFEVCVNERKENITRENGEEGQVRLWTSSMTEENDRELVGKGRDEI